jgi:hypothetical protein
VLYPNKTISGPSPTIEWPPFPITARAEVFNSCPADSSLGDLPDCAKECASEGSSLLGGSAYQSCSILLANTGKDPGACFCLYLQACGAGCDSCWPLSYCRWPHNSCPTQARSLRSRRVCGLETPNLQTLYLNGLFPPP